MDPGDFWAGVTVGVFLAFALMVAAFALVAVDPGLGGDDGQE